MAMTFRHNVSLRNASEHAQPLSAASGTKNGMLLLSQHALNEKHLDHAMPVDDCLSAPGKCLHTQDSALVICKFVLLCV